MVKKLSAKSGFTLIETLVVIGVLAIVVVVGSTSFFSLLKSSTKTKTINAVKQNGDYAMGVMAKMIRNARYIEENTDGQTCEPDMTKIKIKNPDMDSTEFACDGDAISSNSATIISNQVKLESDSCFFDCQEGSSLHPDVVTINFTLRQAQEITRPEEEASIDFTTTISLRNVAPD